MSEDGEETRPAPRAHDVALGGAIAAGRKRAGLSRAALGQTCDVSGQQLRKYETGENRVPIERLRLIARAIGVPVAGLLAAAPPGDARSVAGPADRHRRAAEMMQLVLDMDDALADHLLAVARAAARR